MFLFLKYHQDIIKSLQLTIVGFSLGVATSLKVFSERSLISGLAAGNSWSGVVTTLPGVGTLFPEGLSFLDDNCQLSFSDKPFN